jgi:hypothetical protein
LGAISVLANLERVKNLVISVEKAAIRHLVTRRVALASLWLARVSVFVGETIYISTEDVGRECCGVWTDFILSYYLYDVGGS